MTNFVDFNYVFDLLVEFFTGSYTILAVVFISLFLIIMLAAGLDLRYATLFILPLVAAFVSVGWFFSVGDAQWIVNIVLMVASVFYAWAVLKLTS